MSAQELFLTDFLKEASWVLDEIQSGGASRDGSDWANELGTPRWNVMLRYENLTDAAMRALDAFVIRRRMALISFTMFRPDRRAPLMNGSFVNTGLTLTDTDDEAMTIGLSGLSTTVLSDGDMVSYKTATNGFYIGMITADATPSSGAATVSVWPPPLTPHASPAPKLREAIGEFVLNGRPTVIEPHDRRRGITLNCKQIIRRV